MHADCQVVVRKTENDFHLNSTQNVGSLLNTQTVTGTRNSLIILLKDITGFCGPGSSVGIATGYGLDGPRFESRGKARFSAPVQTGPWAHPAPCIMGTVSFSGVKSGRSVTLTTHPLLVQ